MQAIQCTAEQRIPRRSGKEESKSAKGRCVSEADTGTETTDSALHDRCTPADGIPQPGRSAAERCKYQYGRFRGLPSDHCSLSVHFLTTGGRFNDPQVIARSMIDKEQQVQWPTNSGRGNGPQAA
eukprot:gene10077-biopygen1634